MMKYGKFIEVYNNNPYNGMNGNLSFENNLSGILRCPLNTGLTICVNPW